VLPREPVARALSVAGHPLVCLPLATWIAIASDTSGQQVRRVALAFFALFALGVMLYSWRQVRRGRWGHVDASLPRERRSLNGVLLAALCASAVVVWAQPHARGLAVGITVSCFLIGAAMLAAPWLKVSLHVAFLAFAATLLWRASPAWVAGALLFTGAVGWSRLELGRHSRGEVLAGAGLGLVAGGAFWFAVLS
jgi:membrane-associated phospholipid phosphatase